MLLEAKTLLSKLDESLLATRQSLALTPGLALIWVGNDKQTATFVQKKKLFAKKLNCDFQLHHFESSTPEQVTALIRGLNTKKSIHGIVLQLPLPGDFDTDAIIQTIVAQKDVDNLRGDSPYMAPTPTGVMTLLSYNKIIIKDLKTVILGAGRLVGGPLARVFKQHGWTFDQIESNAAKQSEFIRNHDLLIAATGVAGVVTPEMVHEKMVVVDGSGVDVDVAKIEPLVQMVSPAKGAVGPLTVSYLFANLLEACQKLV